MQRRWLIGGLVASLGLNLFLIGAGVSALALRRDAGAFGAPTPMLQAVQQLAPEHQAAFRRVLRQEGRRISPDLKAARAARRDAARLFTVSPFDRPAVLADLEQARQAETRARTQLETAVVAFAQTLPDDERAALAVSVRRGMETDRRSLRGPRWRLRQAEREPSSASAPAQTIVSPGESGGQGK